MSPSASALLSFALSRALVIVVALLAISLFPIATPCGQSCHLSSVPILDIAARWDGGWYLGIARDGYGHAEGAQTDLAFFPLYPALMRALGALAGGSDDAYLAAGVVLSNVALLVAVVLLARLVALDHGPAVAASAVALLLVFPTTVILSSVYAESLFLACAVAALYFARTGRWGWAGLAGMLGALARPFGFLIALALAVEYVAQRRRHVAGVAAVALPVVAFVSWMAALALMTGDRFAFFTAQAAYGRRAGLPTGAVGDLFDPSAYGNPWFIVAFGGLVAILVVLSWRLLRPSLAAFGTVFLLASVSTGTLTSFLRYALAVFTAFVALAALRSPWARRAYVVAASTTAVLFTAMFALWYWIG
ncbi:MAG TPA: mannosyltransferase family protein [Candidatus Limnocylindria bacterium]|nr:mannosyltransferase family protein [Candidatus Limnocylindria bacterium]